MGIKPSKCKSIFYNLQLPNYLNIKIFLLLTPEFLKFTYPTKQNFYFQKISLSPLFLPHFSLFLAPRSLTLPRSCSLLLLLSLPHALPHALGNTGNQSVTQSISPSPLSPEGNFFTTHTAKTKRYFSIATLITLSIP